MITHGEAGGLQLGAVRLNAANLNGYAAMLSAWSPVLNDGADLLLYGCNVAADWAGERFVEEIGRLVGADVAASTDVTGSDDRGGDWDLEYSVGAIETPAVLDAATDRGWSGQLLIAQMYYVPLPEDQIKASLTRLYASTGTTIDSTISIVPAQNNAIVYYDHWEDGYEANIESPVQATTQVWGDGNPANGMPPGFTTDVLTPDDVIIVTEQHHGAAGHIADPVRRPR